MDNSLRSAGSSRGHIFLVDDHPELRVNLSELLRLTGYTVEEFESAEAFLQHDRSQTPAVVLADMHMPGKSGLDLQHELVMLDQRLPIVFISGGVSPGEMDHAMQRGAAGFLLKPFTRQELCETLDRVLIQPSA